MANASGKQNHQTNHKVYKITTFLEKRETVKQQAKGIKVKRLVKIIRISNQQYKFQEDKRHTGT